ncbi:MAG TPA: DUF5752 family protein, partial [Verrucomicrobiae bacterium]|nr:DUF5752 family protein [Verrucomicrobiae bacterium]
LHYTNDFAQWAGESLEEQALAEHLATLDPYDYCDVSQLREALLDRIDRYLERFPAPRPALPGHEFYFGESVLVSFPVGVRARNLAEFIIALRYVDLRSIYYHFYDARTRLGDGRNDFSLWIEETLGMTALAHRIARIDPFMRPLEGIRRLIIDEVEEELRVEMEGVSP